MRRERAMRDEINEKKKEGGRKGGKKKMEKRKVYTNRKLPNIRE